MPLELPLFGRFNEKNMAKNNNSKIEQLRKTLFKAIDNLCKNMNIAEYKYVMSVLAFLRYISDSFKKLYKKIKKLKREIDKKEEFVFRILIFPLIAPLLVKNGVYRLTSLPIILISLSLYFSVFLFLFGEFSVLIGATGELAEEVKKDPLSFFDKKFAWKLIVFSLYYLWVTWKDQWDIKAIKNYFRSS